MPRTISPANFRKLVTLNARIARILGFETLPQRDPKTGIFTAASSISGNALRAAWSIPPRRGLIEPQRESFKRQLLSAIRARSV